MILSGKVALVTGASRGIGKGIALELAKEGAFVIINYKNNDEAAKEVMKEINKYGAMGAMMKWDVSSFEETNNNINHIIEKYGKIDILINNAGISKIGLFIDSTEGQWDELMNTNLKSVFNTSNIVVKEMLSKGKGTIVNISSIWGNVGASCEVIYSASKGAINSFTKALAKELAPNGIRVNAIAPGVINTEMNAQFSEEEKTQLEEEIPLMRFGEAHEIGKTVVFLCSDSASYITGQVITVDGAYL
ncbi:3-oxoacyl-[acyl-carrier protein] reductase [Clostridium collagenovorans DSM 3089]|uniref:3-oxoacyl-[acyl-carrier protein] reductase n=1 Tax=Clostridium collagenovorans DSM 3089 TaxID=1121306 RepID=A0A1M5TIT5_9CLOT|nr:SDR family oxidoreductase [Clostridium collagenovorans]SHH50560.1 3-oxoacyl-[acyl-carrier protein] reductase [Clostridium collagenovorans DSM 3089]